MKKDANMFLDHIRDSIAVIEDAIKGKSFEELYETCGTYVTGYNWRGGE